MTEKADDEAFMAAALRLARRGLGRVWPNPAVGCVLVRGDRVVGRGWTQDGGRPHAETMALSAAGPAASGATAYISLEPCSHFGKTPPCSEALIAAGIVRVVTATEDPDPRVQGRGHERLREAGIAVTEGVCRLVADDLNAGFFHRVRHGRPMVTLKLAMSLDGRIATHNGQSQWITGAQSRARSHLLRAEHDAAMIGAEGYPLRIVADGRLTLPLTHELVRTAREVPTWLLTRADADRTRRRAFEQVGVEVLTLKGTEAAPLDLGKALKLLAERGLTRVLVEGGGRLAASLLSADLVDRLVVFYADMAIGGDGVPGIAGLGLHRLADATHFRRRSVERVGQDVMVQYSH